MTSLIAGLQAYAEHTGTHIAPLTNCSEPRLTQSIERHIHSSIDQTSWMQNKAELTHTARLTNLPGCKLMQSTLTHTHSTTDQLSRIRAQLEHFGVLQTGDDNIEIIESRGGQFCLSEVTSCNALSLRAFYNNLLTHQAAVHHSPA